MGESRKFQLAVLAAAAAVASTLMVPPAAAQPSGLPPALVVKVDNAAKARPHTGLSSADVIYVEPVEGGITRFAAVYWGRRPSAIGPIRSARETDIKLLRYLDRPVLTYSGASPKLQPLLDKADLVHATPKTAGKAFYRDNDRPRPHNLFVEPRQVPATEPVDMPLHTGPAPAGGKQITSHRVDFEAASYRFTWSTADKAWRVTLDGKPLTSTESGRLRADTVVVQRVTIVTGADIVDSAGNPSPVVDSVGSGPVTVLRGGREYTGTWTRTSADRETVYRTKTGQPLPLGDGQVWILLLPR